ncbi:MAG TPA: UbiA family prenyltransferase [Jiangellaceae bacterium]
MSASIPVLFWRMLRYRVAVMMWMFMLIGIASHGELDRFDVRYVLATVLLMSSYTAATCLNDIADRDVDRINHPKDPGRPLVSGDADERGLLRVYAVAASLTVLAAVPLGLAGLAVAALSLVIGWAYSLGPARISYRTYAAPMVLGIAYALVPYTLGVIAAGERLGRGDAILCAALFLLFLARINLKDFRDRVGDAAYGKPTLLLRYGKTATCAVSLVALWAGTALLVLDVAPPLPVAVLFVGFLGAITSRIYALWRASDGRAEQVAIGIGARAGNGLLISLLALLIVIDSGGSATDANIVVAAVAAAFAADFAVLVRQPALAVIGYKA